MELVMYIKNDCIDRVSIEQAFVSLPGYLGHFVKLLRRRHEVLIRQTGHEPAFSLQNVSVQEYQPALAYTNPEYIMDKKEPHLKKAG